MQKNMVEHDFILRQQEDTKGFEQQRQTRNTKENMMKLEQDTATKADI